MATKNAKKEANLKYQRTHLKQVKFHLHKENEKEEIEIYNSIPNKRQWFLKALRRYKTEKN